MHRASERWARRVAAAALLLAGGGPSCRSPAPADAAADGAPAALLSAEGSSAAAATPRSSASGAPPPGSKGEPGCPPDVTAGEVPWTDGEDPVLPRTVELVVPREARTVVVLGQGATMSFGRDEFAEAARCLRMKLVVDFLAARPLGEEVVSLSEAAAAAAVGSQAQFVVAALLDRGHVRVHDLVTKRDVDSIVRDRWRWMGCGGQCRQNGREYRLRVPGEIFFRTTDRFADGLRRPAPSSALPPGPSAPGGPSR
ncbi:MAG TPA: hypothetical protein PLU22_21845 [Polyangiaceae bacterium]|nr:hypothetical protein [Polyangiaceae bacterium]